MDSSTFQVIVIGGGHAGVEAAWAAANLLPPTARVALVTLDPAKVGVMSCNPAIGGLAKGQLVREVDALGGLMGLATDATGIQFKLLNTSKGPAVQGPRAQCDKHAYARAVQWLIASRPSITVIAGSVEQLLVEGDRLVGVRITPPARGPGSPIRGDDEPAHSPLAGRALWPDGPLELRASACVLTTGTFMRGLMHTGETKTPGGRFGEGAAIGISGALRSLGFELGRLKTGTPPRLARGSIDWQPLAPQPPDERPLPFSDLTVSPLRTSDDLDAWWRNDHAPSEHAARAHTSARLEAWARAGFSGDVFPLLPAVHCRQTATNAHAHDAIRANLHRAPMYSGQIESVGPRYCPSIEDKVVRFADRDSHGVFLEPESFESDWVYCNGISTSLPQDVQEQIVRAMPGCARATIHRFGYAVEYDMVRPHQIHATGHTKLVRGLFLAGQINGTSGYEEAAAQGLVAGLNAALFVQERAEVVLGRDQAYIGVLMDDLVTKTPVEPYRMFTSRAEHRLLLRADNAADRLTPLALELGLLHGSPLGQQRQRAFAARQAQLARLHALVDATSHQGQPLEKLLRGQAFEVDELRAALAGECFDDGVWRTVHAERRYAAYIVRQRAEVRRVAELEHKRLPESIDYLAIHTLRAEARQALHRFRPRTFGQASRLEGVTPADLALLSVLTGRR